MTTIAILDPTSLIGQELKEGLSRRPELAARVELLTTEADAVGALTESQGEPALVRQLETGDLGGVDLLFVCGPMARSKKALSEMDAGATAILLSTDADLEDGIPVVAGVNDERARRGETLLSPAPAVIAVAHLLGPLRDMSPEAAVATAIQPASTHGNEGLDELLDQTRKLLSFQKREEPSLFGGQMAFNILPVASPPRLSEQLAAVLTPPPSVAMATVQGSVFHSLALHLYVRFPKDPGIEDLRDALAASPMIELVEQADALGPVDAAAREEVLVGHVVPDAGPAGGYWIWATMDNLTRGGALNALDVAAGLLGN